MSFPAKQHCTSTAKHLPKATKSAIYLAGDVPVERHDTDCELPFRQESNFIYLSGVEEPSYHLLYDVDADKLHIFTTPRPKDDIVWFGEDEPLAQIKPRYDADQIHITPDLAGILDANNYATIHVLSSTNTAALGSHASKASKEHLAEAITAARMIKDKNEIALMRYANKVSSDAHVSLMRAAKSTVNERELDALFRYETARHGCRFQAYLPIVGAGTNAAILHYGKNDAPLGPLNPNQLVLVDAGGEYHGYAADITRTWPIGGKYVGEARVIYEIVLAMQKAVLLRLKPGVDWVDMHRLASDVCLDGLISAGLVKGDDKEGALAAFIPAIFFPHGLGHFIGLDVHDVGGFPKGADRINEPGIRNLRLLRVLEEGMVVTVEPGCYLVPSLIRPALADPKQRAFLNPEVIERFMDVGGVRIEDCVVITADGHDNLTVAPKEVADIEAIMA